MNKEETNLKANDIKVSVIVPVYNVEQYLEECVQSISSQTYQNIEIVLVDDGSKDSSGKMCDDMSLNDDRIVVIHKENGGLSSARNAGIAKATGDYYIFVDSDDVISPSMVESMVSKAKEYETDIVSSLITEDISLLETGNREDVELFAPYEALKSIFSDLSYKLRYEKSLCSVIIKSSPPYCLYRIRECDLIKEAAIKHIAFYLLKRCFDHKLFILKAVTVHKC